MNIGVHELDFEHPDLAILHVRGEATKQDAIDVGEAIVAFSPGGRVFLLSVNNAAGNLGMSGAARKIFAEKLKDVTLVGVCVVGGDFRVRVVARLLDGVMRVLSKQQTRLHFVDTEEQARVWLRELGCQACMRRSAP